MITLKYKKLVDKDFTTAIVHLQRSKLPLATSKRLKKILEVIVKEQKQYIADAEEQRDAIIGKDLSDKEIELVLAMGTDKEAACFKALEWDESRIEDFKNKYREYDTYCQDAGEADVEIPGEKLRLLESFEFPYNLTMALSDIINLED